MLIVFMMIYPMMTNVSFESLKKIRESKKIVIIGLFFCFIIAPLLFWLLCNIFQAPLDIKTALIILAVAPASSMSLGYVGLSKGNIIAASVIVALAFILCLIIYPISIHFLSITKEVIPFVEIIRSLVFVLILPLTLGLITRETITKKGIDFDKIKPFLSLITLSFLYVLIFVIFSLKGKLIVTHWKDVIVIAPIAIIFYTTMILMILVFNKYIMGLNYEDNQAIVFTTASKNIALTIGLLVTLFGKSSHVMAMYPAIISLFQVVFLMNYLRFSERVNEWWTG